jgi:uncharacterized membrane protein YheB (UPF0754 family)
MNFQINSKTNKSLLTNLIALLIMVIGYFSPVNGNIIFTIGVFALAGSATNWIAIYMLFEKVPFLYGSGVIPNRFEDFKIGIKNLIIEEFFNREHIEKFFKENNQTDSINGKIDFDKVFNGLADAIMNSSMGGMLAMVGGRPALEPLKEPITEKLKEIISELSSGNNNKSGNDFTQTLIAKIENIIDKRLEDLTPKMVKDIIQKMIRKHLGWLVVWGGVFGGLIGFIFSFIS